MGFFLVTAKRRQGRRLGSITHFTAHVSFAFHLATSVAGAFCFLRHTSFRHHHHHYHFKNDGQQWAHSTVKSSTTGSGLFVKSLESSSYLDQINQYAPDDTGDDLVVSGNLTVLQFYDEYNSNNNNTSDQQQQEKQLLSYAVIDKPPSIICHHSEWAGSRAQMQVPMLQRIREAFGGRRVNLIHRLDRGCSGCLLVAFAQDDDNSNNNTSSGTSSSSRSSIDITSNDHGNDGEVASVSYYATVTRRLIQAMNHTRSQKTYIALVRGEGILHGRDFKQEGWFKVDRPIKNENGILRNATTWFRFIAGQPSLVVDDDGQQQLQQPRASLVLARPETGRWHQIRRHLNGLSHPILGDSTHGSSKINREFRALYGMLPERTCLHLARLQLCLDSDNDNDDDESVQKQADGNGHVAAPSYGIDVTCPLAPDMMRMLQEYMPNLLRDAKPILEQEGLFGVLDDNPANRNAFKVLPYTVTVPAS